MTAGFFSCFFSFLVKSDAGSVSLNSGIGSLGYFGLAYHAVGMVPKRYGVVSVVSTYGGFQHDFSFGSEAGGLSVSGGF